MWTIVAISSHSPVLQFLPSHDLPHSQIPHLLHASHSSDHYLWNAKALIHNHWFLSDIFFSVSKGTQVLALPAHAWMRMAGVEIIGDVPISGTAVRELNFLTSPLKVSLFAHRNVKSGGQLPCYSSVHYGLSMLWGVSLENCYNTNSLRKMFQMTGLRIPC